MDNMWKDDNKIIEIYNLTLKGNIHFPCDCPVCNKKAGHIYIQSHNEKHCGIWIWCSECETYVHMSGETPKWWENADFIDKNLLCSEPQYLNSNLSKIDEWVNKKIPNEKICNNTTFVMEDRFNVKFIKKYNEISEGTFGTLLIKNDFIKIDIIFTDMSDKKTKLDILPNEIKNYLEILK